MAIGGSSVLAPVYIAEASPAQRRGALVGLFQINIVVGNADLTEQIVKWHAHGVLIDISALEMVDSFIGRMLSNIANMARLLDAQTVVVGMQPSVAITLVELGMPMKGIRTALDVEKGMQTLRIYLDSNGYTQDGNGSAEI